MRGWITLLFLAFFLDSPCGRANTICSELFLGRPSDRSSELLEPSDPDKTQVIRRLGAAALAGLEPRERDPDLRRVEWLRYLIARGAHIQEHGSPGSPHEQPTGIITLEANGIRYTGTVEEVRPIDLVLDVGLGGRRQQRILPHEGIDLEKIVPGNASRLPMRFDLELVQAGKNLWGTFIPEGAPFKNAGIIFTGTSRGFSWDGHYLWVESVTSEGRKVLLQIRPQEIAELRELPDSPSFNLALLKKGPELTEDLQDPTVRAWLDRSLRSLSSVPDPLQKALFLVRDATRAVMPRSKFTSFFLSSFQGAKGFFGIHARESNTDRLGDSTLGAQIGNHNGSKASGLRLAYLALQEAGIGAQIQTGERPQSRSDLNRAFPIDRGPKHAWLEVFLPDGREYLLDPILGLPPQPLLVDAIGARISYQTPEPLYYQPSPRRSRLQTTPTRRKALIPIESQVEDSVGVSGE